MGYTGKLCNKSKSRRQTLSHETCGWQVPWRNLSNVSWLVSTHSNQALICSRSVVTISRNKTRDQLDVVRTFDPDDPISTIHRQPTSTSVSVVNKPVRTSNRDAKI